MAMSNIARVAVRRNPSYQPNGTKSLVYLFHKYGIHPTKPGRYHRNQHGALLKRQQDGTAVPVTADDQQNDSFYTCLVLIGTPAQALQMDFDSGSADLWVWSSLLPESVLKSKAASGPVVFDPSGSSTFQDMSGSSWHIRYGDSSSASGTVGMDIVKVGNIEIQSQAIELANKMSVQLQNQSTSNGLVGLAFGSINTVTPTPVRTPLENMILQNDISDNEELFTCYMGSYKDAKDPDQGQSFYTFGGIDQSAVAASGQDLLYTPIDNSDGFWKFDSPSVVINGNQIDLPDNKAIADTGTTLLLVSNQICDEFYGLVPGAVYSEDDQGWVFPNNTRTQDLPTISFAVGGRQITIDKEHIGFASSSVKGMVFGGIQSQGSLGFNIFGDTFLKNVYAVFDAGNSRFGVVKRADPTPNGPQA